MSREKSVSAKISCHSCNIEMTPDILMIHFPKGALPARGYRCPKCPEELIPFDEAKRVEELAERVGMFGAVNPLIKTITRCGNNLAVYIPKEFEKELNLKKGERIKVWRQDDEIVVKPVTES